MFLTEVVSQTPKHNGANIVRNALNDPGTRGRTQIFRS